MVESKIIGTTLYVGLTGELDESCATAVRSRLDILVGDERITKVVVELSQLKFMDSTGIGVLIGRYKSLRARGVPIFVANPTAAVDKILTLSGIYGIMPKVELREEA